MLSFEVSIIDLVLFVAIVVLFILHLRSSTDLEWLKPEKKIVYSERVENKMEEKTGSLERKEDLEEISAVSGECIYGFGYLRKHAKGASVPGECMVCYRMLECRSATLISENK
jgi:hypothetical protein